MGKPYQEEEWLRREYVEKGRTLSDIADQFDMTTPGITHWMDKYGIERRGQKEAQKPDKPYTNKEWLKTEYVDNRRSMRDISGECGVSAAVILKWLRRFDIETRHSANWKRLKPISLTNTPRGYVSISAKHNGETERCYHHQLLAIAEGADPNKIFSGGDYHVHHKNGVPWDNRPENLEFIRGSDHLSKHFEEREQTPTGELI